MLPLALLIIYKPPNTPTQKAVLLATTVPVPIRFGDCPTNPCKAPTNKTIPHSEGKLHALPLLLSLSPIP